MGESLSRREALGLGLTATLGGMAGAPAVGADAPPPAAAPALAPLPRRAAPGPGRDGLQRFLRMRSAPGLGPVMWSYSGVLVVKPEGVVAQPVTRVEGMSYTHATPRADGAYDWHLDEVGYYCDLDTGRPLGEFVNPFTAARIRAVHYRSPQKLIFGPDRIDTPEPQPPGSEGRGDFRGEITTLADFGDRLAMTEDLYVRLPATPARDGRPARGARVFASLATFTAKRAELDAAGDRWIDCEFTYATMNTFSGWLGMGAIPGIQSMRLVGQKRAERDLAAVPAWLRERIASDHPGFLRA